MSVQPALVVVTTEQIDRDTESDFRAELAEGLSRFVASPDSPSDLVVDLRHLIFLDSSGIRMLIDTAQAVERRGGRLVICGARDGARRCLQTTGVLERYDGASSHGMAE